MENENKMINTSIEKFIENLFFNPSNKINKEDFYFKNEDVPVLVFRGIEYRGDKGSEEFCKNINKIVTNLNLTLNLLDKDLRIDNDIIIEEVNHYNKIYNMFEIRLDNHAMSKGKK